MSTAIVWFRRDLRLHDHPPLTEALAEHDEVVPLFVLDPRLVRGRFASANRTQYLLDCLTALDQRLGGALVVRHGHFETEIPKLAEETGASAVYAAGDVSPYARARDKRVAQHVELCLGPGNFIARLADLTTKSGTRFKVYSPFRRAWLEQPRRGVLEAPEVRAAKARSDGIPTLTALGFDAAIELEDRPEPGEDAALKAAKAWARDGVRTYAEDRNVLSRATSRMSQYLHFGCLSPLLLEQQTRDFRVYRGELAWRDFYAYVQLFGGTRRPDPRWDDDPELLQAWKEGRTGYPVVDAAMRQLVACGWMHNRARMIVASFLTKDLHLDWREGERFFMEHLIDGDVGNNNGGWQWVAGTGTDPQDYTRVFNPTLQQKRFDPDGSYVRRWLPDPEDYPPPIVDHKAERERAIADYRDVRG
ncbi:MAG: deoxyribodipyrimidine photo-lyase [Solirubrobacteraceae bacterium]|nr:deoxyribodipyrimidine photo-lyase [Solirubrobacteraceae bacterium]